MTGDVIQPTFHHVSLKTARLQEMIDFSATLVGAEVIAYEYAGLAELNATYLRLMQAGIEPAFCLDHGMALSYFLRRSGRQPCRAADGRLRRVGVVGGIPFEDIHAKAMRGAYAPQQAARRRFAAGGRSTRRFDEAAAVMDIAIRGSRGPRSRRSSRSRPDQGCRAARRPAAVGVALTMACYWACFAPCRP